MSIPMEGDVEWNEGGNRHAGKIERAFDRGDELYAEYDWPKESFYRITIYSDARPSKWEQGQHRNGPIKNVQITKTASNAIISGLWIEGTLESEFRMNLHEA